MIVVSVLAFAHLATGIARSLTEPPPVQAHTAYPGSFSYIYYLNDYWANYDGSGSYGSSSVDWPLRFILYGSAEVDYVKYRLDGCNGDPTISPQLCNATATGPMQFHNGDNIDNGGQGSWVGTDTDSGIKQTVGCSWYYHMRVYARSDTDHNYNPDYSFYVFMTVHQDYETVWPGCFPNKYRSYETHEDHFVWRAQQVPGWVAYPDLSYQYNYEPNREWSSNAFVESDGYVSYIYVQ
jgi:hypothetical protein